VAPRALRVAVGVMAHNEEANVSRCLESLLSQPLSGDVALGQVVVVASGCTDRTVELAQAAARRDSRVKVVVEPARRGKATAVNRFLAVTDEPVCVVTGGDVVFAPGSLQKLVRPLCDPEVGMTGARPVPTNARHGVVAEAVHILWQLHHHAASRRPKMGEAVAFKRAFDAIDPTTLVDEASIESAIAARGLELRYVPEATVYNRGPATLRELFAQRQRIHLGHLALAARHGYQPATMRLGVIAAALAGLLATSLASFRALSVLVAVELAAWAQARTAFTFNSQHRTGIWQPIRTTKRVLADGHAVRVFHDGYMEFEVRPPQTGARWRGWWGSPANASRLFARRRHLARQLRRDDVVRPHVRGLRLRLRTDPMGSAAAIARVRVALAGDWVIEAAGKSEGGPAVWRRVLADRFLRDSGWLAAAISLVNVASYLLSVALTRLLPEAEFGEQAALISLFVLISVPISSLQTLITREEGARRAEGSRGDYFRRVRRQVAPWAWLTLIAGIAASPAIKAFMHLESSRPAILLVVFVVSALWLSMYRGLLQADRRFPWLAANIGLEATLRVVLSILFVVSGMGAAGVLAGYAASSVILIPVSWWMVGHVRQATSAERTGFRHLGELLPVVAALGMTTALFNIDVMLARHFLPAATAGEYAGLSLMGRVLFYLTSSLGGAIMVSVAAAAGRDEQSRVLIKAVAITGSAALSVAVVYLLAGRQLIGLAFGNAYVDAAGALPLITIGMAALALTNTMVYFLLAMREVRFIAVLAVVVLLEVLMVQWHHSTPIDIATALATGATLAAAGVSMITLARFGTRARLRTVSLT
jgi:O-antigen/teichoic acid export membrane protein/glycosyltransferase involved in cell wall biosynthesis